jgi:hypothetical protein
MGHADDFRHLARAVEVVEPWIAIGMHGRSTGLPTGTPPLAPPAY